MPRPVKSRKVCHYPQTQAFHPIGENENKDSIVLWIEEYETIRLIDKEGFSQEQCSAFMQIARATVQRIYETARQKIATALVEGRPLRIEGGDYTICDGQNLDCGHYACEKYQYRQQYNNKKGDYIMRIAVTYENEEIFQHFGHHGTDRSGSGQLQLRICLRYQPSGCPTLPPGRPNRKDSPLPFGRLKQAEHVTVFRLFDNCLTSG